MSGTPALKDVHYIEDPRQARAAMTPLRMRVLELLAGREMTGSELAAELHLPAPRLHYHLGALVRSGLVRKVREERRRNLVAKLHRAIARRFVLGAALATGSGEASPAEGAASVEGPTVHQAAEGLAADAAVLAASPGGGAGALVQRRSLGLSRRDLERLAREVGRLLDRYERRRPGARRGHTVVFACYPAAAARPRGAPPRRRVRRGRGR
ncbi:MAG: helix-turn-helix transcriptional regulator [Planctomycetes bacterium]|nr:helix-turn-helix transcriptional regulator [Planctomycetota bacterium]